MKLYAVKIVGEEKPIALVHAQNPKDASWLIDEFFDPSIAEIKPIKGPFYIGWENKLEKNPRLDGWSMDTPLDMLNDEYDLTMEDQIEDSEWIKEERRKANKGWTKLSNIFYESFYGWFKSLSPGEAIPMEGGSKSVPPIVPPSVPL